jgi:hypothetical protein
VIRGSTPAPPRESRTHHFTKIEVLMGYSVNPTLVEQRRALVSNLERGIETSWVISSNDPADTQRHAYDIRETLYIASLYPKRFPKLAEAYRLFSIHVVRPGRIEARRKAGNGDITVQGLETYGKPVPLIGLSAEEIIQSWMSHLPSNDALHFTQCKLSYDDLIGLHAWVSSRKPKMMMLWDEATSRLTLSLNDPTVEEYAWKPTEVRPPQENLDV